MGWQSSIVIHWQPTAESTQYAASAGALASAEAPGVGAHAGTLAMEINAIPSVRSMLNSSIEGALQLMGSPNNSIGETDDP